MGKKLSDVDLTLTGMLRAEASPSLIQMNTPSPPHTSTTMTYCAATGPNGGLSNCQPFKTVILFLLIVLSYFITAMGHWHK